MNLQQALQPRSSANGFGRRRNDRETGPRLESKLQTGKTNSSRLTSAGKEGGCESPSRERLVYLTTCLIGHHVEVQVQDGSVFSGIFHATNAEKDFGIILKMSRLIKDGSRGHKNNTDAVSRPPSRTLIIPAKELVQVIAKGVPVTQDGLTNELLREQQQELMIDSCISQSRHAEVERELERWVPDNDDLECPELDNIFDGPWNRGWDQFEVNETLFGVKSTFNEELYTTKLERGPRTRELEKEALRIAREIEGEETNNLHLAEERGIQLLGNLEIDEETRFSSVIRRVDDSGYDDSEDILLDTCNDETFGGVSHSVIGKPIMDLSSGKTGDAAQMPQRSLSMDEVQTSQSSMSRELNQYGSADTVGHLSVEHLLKNVSAMDDIRFQENHYTNDDVEKQNLPEEDHMSKPDDTWSTQSLKKESFDKGGLSANATAYAPSHVLPKSEEKTNSSSEPPVGLVSSKVQRTAQSSSTPAGPSTSASSTSDGGGAPTSSGLGLSPSSSVGSLSSEKSTLNPHAKEFRLNPNAKSFIPTQTPLRPASPVSEGSFYYPANLGAVPHMHGMPVGVGIGPSYSAHQPVIFNPQAAPTTQPYFPPNGPQMMFGHPRQFVYMPTYPAEMPYKGRDF